MSDAPPIHVCVAVALGWANVSGPVSVLLGQEPIWIGRPPEWSRKATSASIDMASRAVELTFGARSVDRYDTDWGASGPLIQWFGLALLPGKLGWYAVPREEVPWVAESPDIQMLLDGHLPLYDPAPDPLRAVCERILALHTAGLLPRP